MTAELMRFGTLPVTAWRNGAGRKADIASTDGWNVGFAWLDGDAPFSDFTGHDRTITLIDGTGFTLGFTGRPALHVDEPFRPSPFDGGWETLCSLRGGPCVVLNAMTVRDTYRHDVTIADIGTDPRVDPTATATFLVLLTGTATLPGGAVLQPRDAVRLDEPVSFAGPTGSRIAVIAIHPIAG